MSAIRTVLSAAVACVSLCTSAQALTLIDRNLEVIDLGDIILTPDDGSGGATGTGTHTPSADCVRQCSDAVHQCQIDQYNQYRECRESAYEHVNWLIQLTGTIDFGLLQDMLEACDLAANTDGELCGGIYEACLDGCE